MSRSYIDGKTVVVFIKRTNHPTTAETEFSAVACLDSNSFSGSKEKKVVTNKCTGGWEDGISGNGSWQMEVSGQAIDDAASSERNYQVLAELWASGEKFEVKMANADDSFYRAGEAMITDWSEEANSEDPVSFSATFSGLGAPVLVSA